jgi:hypothetical protein
VQEGPTRAEKKRVNKRKMKTRLKLLPFLKLTLGASCLSVNFSALFSGMQSAPFQRLKAISFLKLIRIYFCDSSVRISSGRDFLFAPSQEV